ncbi:hypothetical protein BVH03_04515 [Pseudomonas sp. PA15(2017)]|uniref:CesT family type III secretion system chaperone n=1 Tax=Pseudomonas sp. PA15(2017) TaxID=1932111 RepID=UPI00095C9EAB|nr:CesT family type III secretion system chaperone [Pseudomonas sp. PA15(2017)]OLU33692.1 hypothetical protein BVH03_04515 [Pseudomonas sp. PA15(2017)]
MSLKNYHQLIDAICELTMLPDPASLYEVANISVQNVNFSLLYKENPAYGDVQIYCGFGPLPKQQREPVLQRLLETNLYLSTGPGTPTLAYNPETGQVVLVCSLPLDVLGAQQLLDMLGYLAHMAKQWQSNYFLGNEGAQAQGQNNQLAPTTQRNFNTADQR